MTILLHGEDSTASRNRLIQLRSQSPTEVVEITDPSQIIETSLFGNQKTFIIWIDKQLTPTQIKKMEEKFGTLTVEQFSIKPVIFQLLDNLAPGAQKTFFPFWFDYIRSEPADLALIMLARQFRFLLDPENSDVQTWQKTKLQQQAKKFSFLSLRQIYKKLLEIDFQNKTGQAPTSLRTSIELLLATI